MGNRGSQEAERPPSACPMHNRAYDSTDPKKAREKSTILGKSENEVWEYPSQEMFLNALKKKNQAEGVTEETLPSIIKIHNKMNEDAWEKILEYEAFHLSWFNDEVTMQELPRLVSFTGRPHDLTPKGFFKKYILRKDLFDRHDWIVQRRLSGMVEETRYVIDYYYQDKDKNQIEIDVRPALDSPKSLYHRLKHFYGEKMNLLPDTSPLTLKEYPDNELSLEAKSKKITEDCHDVFTKLNTCATPKECNTLSLRMTLCMANIVCPAEYDKIQVTDDETLDLTPIQGPMDQFEEDMKKYKQQAHN